MGKDQDDTLVQYISSEKKTPDHWKISCTFIPKNVLVVRVPIFVMAHQWRMTRMKKMASSSLSVRATLGMPEMSFHKLEVVMVCL